jgi:SNF2 family DNA or RNA helicase
MCRYTKAGTVDGAVNLELPPLAERVVECALAGDDRKWYRKTQRDLFKKTLGHLRAGIAKSTSKEMTVPELLAQPAVLHQLCAESKINSKRVRSYATAARATCGGAHGVKTGEVGEYNPRRGATEILQHRCCGSKADAVVTELVRIRAADPAAKVLVFSEFAETLRAVQARLPALGLDHRVVISNTSHKKRGEAIEAFMSDPPTRVFLLGAQAGAVGITLTAASVVLICEPLLNPALELQAVGRARRMGQTKATTVLRLFLKDSVEERLRAWLARAAAPSAARSTILQCNGEATELKLKIGVVHNLLECGLESSDDEDEGGAGGDSEVNLVSDDE